MKQSPPFWRQPQIRNVVWRGKSDLFALCPRGVVGTSLSEQNSLIAAQLSSAAFSCQLQFACSTWLFCKETCRRRLAFRAQETRAEEHLLLCHLDRVLLGLHAGMQPCAVVPLCEPWLSPKNTKR